MLLAVLAAAVISAGAGPVKMKVSTFDRRPISPYIYGLNFADRKDVWGSGVPTGVTLTRLGGNRTSTYNWEINASNCGNDCGDAYSNDDYLGGAGPGGAVARTVSWAAARGAAALVTVPMLGWVSADKDGPVPLRLPLAQRRKRFVPSKARKGAPFSAQPDLRDDAVYQDEFVAWLERSAHKLGGASPTVFYSLDNEPDLWGSTHEEARGNRLKRDRYLLTGYAQLVELSAEYAAAIKDVAPRAVVFGPALSGWNGFQNLYHNDAPDPAGREFFLAYYLEGMRKASEARGRRLLDVLDVHWYPMATSRRFQAVGNEWAEQDDAMIAARVAAPRSLWDPDYTERSWVAQQAGGPIRLLPRLREIIALHYPGTRIAITEYFWHRAGDISGAVAQADALGIFGREEVFAATLWPQGAVWAYQGDLDRTYACALAAFRSFRDYDGHGAAFGDVSLRATTSDPERTALYASAVTDGPQRLVLVAVNRSTEPVEAAIALDSVVTYGRAELWRLTGAVGRCSGPSPVSPDPAVSGDTVRVTLPPLSVSTLALRP